MQATSFFLILVVAISFLPSSVMVFGQEQEWLTYEDPFLGIKIQHPSDWTKNATASSISFNKLDTGQNLGLGVYALAISLMDLQPGDDKRLDQMVRETIGTLREFPGFELIEYSKTATLAGLPAYKVTWVAPYEDLFFLKIVNYFVIKDNTGYIVSYTVFDQKKDNLDKALQSQLPTFQKMVDSFAIVS